MRSISTVASAVLIVVIIVIAAGASALILLSPSVTSTTSTFTQLPSTTTSQSPLTTTPTSTSSTAATSSTQPVTFFLDFAPSGYHALFSYGLAQGLYAQNGMSVTITPGTGSASTIQYIASGKADFGFADLATLAALTGKANVTNVVAVAMIWPRTPFGIYCNNATVPSIKDMNGKSMGTFSGAAPLVLFPVFAKLGGINASSVKLVNVAPALLGSGLASKKFDCATAVINNLGPWQPAAASNGVSLRFYGYAQYGMDIYGSVILTSKQLIQTNPSLVRKFVNATMSSVILAVHNQQSAIAALLKYNPQLGAQPSLQDLQFLISYSMVGANSSEYTRNPLAYGWMEPAKVQNTANIAVQAYSVSPVNASSIFTDQFVSKP